MLKIYKYYFNTNSFKIANSNTKATPATQQDESVSSQPDSTDSAIVSVKNNIITVLDEKSMLSSLFLENEQPCYEVLLGKRKQVRKKADHVKLIDDIIGLNSVTFLLYLFKDNPMVQR